MSKLALQITGLSKTYETGTKALKSVDLEVRSGDFFSLLGANGAGKTTLIGIVTGTVKKTGGKVKVFGIDVDENHNKAKQMIGLVPQEFNFNIFEKVGDIVVQQAGYFGIPRKEACKRAEPILKILDLWDKRNTVSMRLSGGMKRRLMIARALIHQPKLLILDEPTAGVDVELRRETWEYLKKLNAQGVTILLTTHYLEEAESLCRNIAIINHGEIVENTSVKALLKTLNKEHFVLDTKEAVTTLPVLKGYNCQLLEDHSIEIEVEKGQSLNPVFLALQDQGVEVLSMRNKANRLEELFVAMVSKKSGAKL